MRRDEAIAKLRATEPALRAHRVKALYLFGLHARDDAASDSDIDVFVDPASSEYFGFLPFMQAYETMGKQLGTKWRLDILRAKDWIITSART